MKPLGRRCALALLPAVMLTRSAGANTPPAGSLDVWIDLDLPALATVPRRASREREALQTRIRAQQDAVMAQLQQLGGHELGRVQVLRNAVAVRLPSGQLDTARRLPGVRAVHAVRDTPRHPPRTER